MRFNQFIIIHVFIFLFPIVGFGDEYSFRNHMDNGRKFFEEGLLEKSIKEYEKAIAINPRAANAYLGLAYSCQEMNSIDFEKRRFDYLTRVFGGEELESPKYTEIGSQFYRKAIDAFLKTIELDDTIWQAHYFLGAHYSNNKLYRDAEREFKKTISLNPEYINCS